MMDESKVAQNPDSCELITSSARECIKSFYFNKLNGSIHNCELYCWSNYLAWVDSFIKQIDNSLQSDIAISGFFSLTDGEIDFHNFDGVSKVWLDGEKKKFNESRINCGKNCDRDEYYYGQRAAHTLESILKIKPGEKYYSPVLDYSIGIKYTLNTSRVKDILNLQKEQIELMVLVYSDMLQRLTVFDQRVWSVTAEIPEDGGVILFTFKTTIK
jgi:hypothetical protein